MTDAALTRQSREHRHKQENGSFDGGACSLFRHVYCGNRECAANRRERVPPEDGRHDEVHDPVDERYDRTNVARRSHSGVEKADVPTNATHVEVDASHVRYRRQTGNEGARVEKAGASDA